MSQYGQFCPVAKAAEILGERWTLLIVRQLLIGATRFTELQRSLAKASPTILVKRLRYLESVGIIVRDQGARGRNVEYRLTSSGRELLPLIEQMGTWATRWASTQLEADELDEYLLITDIRRRIKIDQLPVDTATLYFHLTGQKVRKKWWLVLADGEIDICDRDPGYEVDLYIETTLRRMVEIWLGRKSFTDARRTGKLKVNGNRALVTSMPRWFGFSGFADTPRPSGPVV